MVIPPIYTILNVPTVTSHPSANCLQWSADGQVCFATKNAAYIMTPDHGIHFDTTSVIKSPHEKDSRGNIPSIGWFRTIIPFEKSDAHKWPDHSQVWGAVSLGSIDVSLWAVAFSPSGLSPDAGCILAALSSNMDFTLWTAAKNCLKGEWIKIYEVTPFLLTLSPPDGDQASRTSRTVKAQITSITWSSQADFGLTPAPKLDGSLLVGGNRAGLLVIMRYRDNQTIEHIKTLTVSGTWITHVAFSPWTVIQPGICEAQLGYATADGSVGIVKVTQLVSEAIGLIQRAGSLDLQVIFDEEPKQLYEADSRGTTALSWVKIGGAGAILVHCKPGTIHLWSLSANWMGHRQFLLRNQKISAGSSPFHAPSGIQYVRRRDILILTLFDGSLHVVHNVSHEPSLNPPTANDHVTSNSLSLTIRSAFIQSEQGDVEYSDVNRITGLTSYDSSSTFIWLHEASRPSDFSYKHDAKHNSVIMVAKVWDDTDDDALISDLTQVLDDSKTAAGYAPLHLLRPFFFRLRDKDKINSLLPRILEVLQPRFDDHSVLITVPSWTSVTQEARLEFRKSLAQHLFGWDVLLSLRMRLSVADFSWKLSGDKKKQDECGRVAQTLLNTISHRVLRTIIRHLVASVTVLTANNMPFVMRMVVQSLLPGSPEDLSAEGHYLSAISQAAMPAETMGNNFNEYCPACGVEVPLQDITTAVCSNGHTWARCSVTTFILSTPLVRTCIGCSRKAFLPLSTPNPSAIPNWLPPAARCWVVEELLEAVHRCLFCNNSFVSVL